MAHHEHVHVFVQRVDGVGARGVGGRRQHIGLAHHFQNVGRMPATSTFGMKRVDGASFERGHRVFYKARFIEGVGVNSHLGVGFFCHVQAVVNGCRSGAPVFVQLESNGSRFNLLMQGCRQAGVTLTQKAQVHRKRLCGLEHALHIPRAGRAGGGKCACGGASAATNHGGDATA